MDIWDATVGALRSARRFPPDQRLTLLIGTWPVEQGQSVWVTYQIEHDEGSPEEGRVEAVWQYNPGADSFWRAEIGPFQKAVCVSLHSPWLFRGRFLLHAHRKHDHDPLRMCLYTNR